MGKGRPWGFFDACSSSPSTTAFSYDCKIIVLEGFKYIGIDGDLVGVVGDLGILSEFPIVENSLNFWCTL